MNLLMLRCSRAQPGSLEAWMANSHVSDVRELGGSKPNYLGVQSSFKTRRASTAL